MLASASPRRHELMRAAGLRFDVVASGIDERPPSRLGPLRYVRWAARAKAQAVAATRPRDIVIGADTEVVLDRRIFGKPRDRREAQVFLRALSGRTHQVYTAIHVIAGMLGLPEADLPRFHRWAVELINIAGDIQRGLAASQTLRDYFAGVLAARRRDPQEDMISVLAHAELDGQRLTDEEIFAFLRLLLPAGAETTYRSSSNLFCGLLTHPDQLEAVRADRSLVRRAIDEGLRWEPPLTGIARIATRDVEVAGVEIPKGAVVSVCLGAANHDPARYPAPETFDIRREQRPHLAFAYGPHTCVGMHLARMETRVVLEAVLDRLPNLRLDPEAPDVHITGLSFRAPRRLPVLFG